MHDKPNEPFNKIHSNYPHRHTKVTKRRPGEIALLGKYLSCKQEDPNSIPRTHFKKQSVRWTCNPSTGEAEMGGPLGFTCQSSSLLGKLLISEAQSQNQGALEE